MPPPLSTDLTLRAENAELRARLEEAERMIRAIRAGELSALLVEGDADPRTYTAQGLEAEQNLLRGGVLAQLSDAVIAVDTEECITFLNAAAECQYGVRARDVLGRKLTEIYTRHWPDPEAEAACWATLRDRGEWRGETFQRTHDGRELYVESSVTALRGFDGLSTGFAEVTRDITGGHQAEASLRQNTALFSEIIEQAPGGVYVVDAQFRVAQMNAQALPFFAMVQPLIGRDFGDALGTLWGSEIGPQIASIFRHTLVTGERYVSPRFSEQRLDIGVEQAFEWETHRITLPDGQHGVVCYFQEVTAREHAEAALRLTSERLALAVKCSQVVLFQQDLELRYTWLQNAAPGFEGSDAIGKRDPDLMERAADAAVIEALKREVIRSGVSQRQEVLVHIQGAGRHYDLLVEPQRDAAGLISGVTGAAIEITERKRAEEARLESERHYRTLVMASSAVVFRMSADWSEMHQLDGQDFIVDTTAPSVLWVEEYLFPEDQLQVLAVIRDAIRTKSPFEMEHRIRRVDGSAGWTSSHAIPLLDAKGEIVEWFGAASDVTARKDAEQALNHRTELLNGLLQGTTDVIYVKDLNCRILLANAAFAAAARSTPEQLVGKTTEELFPPDEAAVIRQHDEAVIAGGSPIQLEETILEAGEPRVFLSLKAPLRDGAGHVIGLLGISRDITERKRIELNLTHAVAVAEKASRAKSDFLSNMSHELRTPLNAILGFAQLMASGTPALTSAQNRSLEQILKGGWYLLDLINELLNLAVIDSGKLSLKLERVSLAEVMLVCQAMIEPQARRCAIEMTFPSFEIADSVCADRTRVQQVVINLLSNAIKYNKAQGAVAVEWTLSPPDAIRISVRDTGEGLAPDKIAQLFQPFNRLGQEHGPQVGTGIGLAMTKHLVELMGGAIGVDSVVGVGSVFWFELKRASTPQSALLQAEGSAQAPSNVSPPDLPGTQRRTVLHVENNPANQELIKQLLARRPDLRLLSAADGNRGIELTRAHQPQVILMDVSLPGISGMEAMKILRADPSTAHIPIVALSANALPRDIEDGIKAGFFNYLTKPFMVAQFMDTLDEALKTSPTVPALRQAASMRSEPSTETEVSVKANVGFLDVKRSGRN